MALGKRKVAQQPLLVATTSLPQSPGHPFYEKLNQLLAEASSAATTGTTGRHTCESWRPRKGSKTPRTRSFAHTCETGGARRSRLRGLIDVAKRYLMYVAGRNLGVIMRAIFGIGTPKSLQTGGEGSACAVFRWLTDAWTVVRRMWRFLTTPAAHSIRPQPRWTLLCAA